MTQFLKLNRARGFTLIELIVVIAIIGLLASIVLVSTNAAIGKAKIARNLRFSQSVHSAVGAYLVGEWKFGEAQLDNCPPSGYKTCYSTPINDFCDSSGNGNHGGIRGTVSTADSGVPQLGQAIFSPGGENFVVVCDSPILRDMDELTISAWIKPLSEVTSLGISAVWKFESYILELDEQIVGGIKRGVIDFTVKAEATPYYSFSSLVDTDPFKIGQWYHIAATYYGGGGNIYPRTRVFLNGHLMKDETINDWAPGTSLTCYDISCAPSGIEAIRLGGYTTYNTQAVFDEVRIYQGELTSSQIKKLYVEGAKERGLLTEK